MVKYIYIEGNVATFCIYVMAFHIRVATFRLRFAAFAFILLFFHIHFVAFRISDAAIRFVVFALIFWLFVFV